MASESEDDKILLPHHEQQSLCTTRLPYRQGRKLTAVKVYTINDESNHLLIFGVPSLNLRQEAKALFFKFGKLIQFTLQTEYKTEQFTETYHAVYEKIQSARIAKKMLDTKNFYGSSLHVTYAPELENISETKQKLMQRKYDVLARLRNLEKEESLDERKVEPQTEVKKEVPKLNMGDVNEINLHSAVSRKRKLKPNIETFKPCFLNCDETSKDSKNKNYNLEMPLARTSTTMTVKENPKTINNCNIEIVDCTSTENDTITNINEHLNYDKFDNIKIYKVAEKPVNKIKFTINKKT